MLSSQLAKVWWGPQPKALLRARAPGSEPSELSARAIDDQRARVDAVGLALAHEDVAQADQRASPGSSSAIHASSWAPVTELERRAWRAAGGGRGAAALLRGGREQAC